MFPCAPPSFDHRVEDDAGALVAPLDSFSNLPFAWFPLGCHLYPVRTWTSEMVLAS
jgi:hypothetical protein